MTEVIHLCLAKDHCRKLQSGKGFQLNANKLKDAINGTSNAEIHLATKDARALQRAINNNRGYRFASNKIVGGKLHINWKKVGRVLAPIARAVGHIGLNMASKYAKEQGIDTKGFDKLGHEAIDAKDTNDLKRVGKKAGMKLANEGLHFAKDKLADYMAEHDATGGKINIMKGLRSTGRVLGKVMKNPIVQNVASDLIVAGLMGAGKRKLVKGSAEAKAHMAKLRAMRRRGGALMPAGMM